MYGACGSSLHLMTGMHDVTTRTDIVYGNISELMFHTFLLKIISRVPVRGHALLENAIRYHDSDFTVA